MQYSSYFQIESPATSSVTYTVDVKIIMFKAVKNTHRKNGR